MPSLVLKQVKGLIVHHEFCYKWRTKAQRLGSETETELNRKHNLKSCHFQLGVAIWGLTVYPLPIPEIEKLQLSARSLDLQFNSLCSPPPIEKLPFSVRSWDLQFSRLPTPKFEMQLPFLFRWQSTVPAPRKSSRASLAAGLILWKHRFWSLLFTYFLVNFQIYASDQIKMHYIVMKETF